MNTTPTPRTDNIFSCSQYGKIEYALFAMELERELAIMNAELLALKAERSETEWRCLRTLSEENQKLTADLAHVTAERDDLENDLRDADIGVDKRVRRMLEAEEKVRVQFHESAELRARNAELENKIVGQEEQLKAITNTKCGFGGYLDEIHNEQTRLEKHNAELEKLLQANVDGRLAAEDRGRELEAEIAGAEYCNAELESERQKIADIVAPVLTERDNLKQRNAELVAALVSIRDMPFVDRFNEYRLREVAKLALARAESPTPAPILDNAAEADLYRVRGIGAQHDSEIPDAMGGTQ